MLTVRLRSWLVLVLACLILWNASIAEAMAAYPRDRLFLPVALTVVETVKIPPLTFAGESIQALSALTYDPTHDRLYAAGKPNAGEPSQVYTLKLQGLFPQRLPDLTLQVESKTGLQLPPAVNSELPANPLTLDGIVLSPESSLFGVGEMRTAEQTQPFICQFDPATGQQQDCLELPQRYLPQPDIELGGTFHFQALTLVAGGMSNDPYPLFTTAQFVPRAGADSTHTIVPTQAHWLQYLFNSGDRPFWLADYLYPLESSESRLVQALPLGQSGHFLSLEQTGDQAKLYQVAIADATDTSQMDSLIYAPSVKPLRKTLILDFQSLVVPMTATNSMSFGPRLSNGDRSILVLGRSTESSLDHPSTLLVLDLKASKSSQRG
jgi:Esterase-like activity of phytase